MPPGTLRRPHLWPPPDELQRHLQQARQQQCTGQAGMPEQGSRESLPAVEALPAAKAECLPPLPGHCRHCRPQAPRSQKRHDSGVGSARQVDIVRVKQSHIRLQRMRHPPLARAGATAASGGPAACRRCCSRIGTPCDRTAARWRQRASPELATLPTATGLRLQRSAASHRAASPLCSACSPRGPAAPGPQR